MIDDLKAYPEYKESGLPWLGKVPAHWRVVRNGNLFRQRNQTGFAELPILEVSLRTGVRVRDFATSNRKQVMSDFGKYKRAAAGDIAYNMMRMWQGAVGIAPVDGLVSPAYVVATPYDGVEARYFNELFRTAAYMAEVDNCSRGIVKDRNRLYWDQFKQLMSPCPPPVEQAAIVRFLGWATGQVDLAILSKRKVIALLNEQKEVVVNAALTRGLNNSVRFKPSGSVWLGEIPEHWSIKRFKFLASINSGQVDPRQSAFKNRPLIAPNHIESGTGKLLRLETADDQGADSGKYEVRKDQVIYSKIRPALRKAVIAPVNCLCSADMYPISPKNDEISVEYLLSLLLSQPFTKFAVDTSMRVAMPKVNREALAECLLWYPSLSEQKDILGHIALVTAPISKSIDALMREIALLKEYRTRLIVQTVFGVADIRPLASALPDSIAPIETIPSFEEDDPSIGEEIAA